MKQRTLLALPCRPRQGADDRHLAQRGAGDSVQPHSATNTAAG